MQSDNIIARPRVLVIPSDNENELTYAEIGTIVMSGAKMYICVSKGNFELVTSA